MTEAALWRVPSRILDCSSITSPSPVADSEQSGEDSAHKGVWVRMEGRIGALMNFCWVQLPGPSAVLASKGICAERED